MPPVGHQGDRPAEGAHFSGELGGAAPGVGPLGVVVGAQVFVALGGVGQ
jgi:hypothetical protein